MANITVGNWYPPPISQTSMIGNGFVPNWKAAYRIARGLNFSLAQCRKVVFCKSTVPNNAPQGVASQQIPWRWHCRTGEASGTASSLQMTAELIMLPSDNAAHGSDPRVRMVLVNGGTTNSDYMRYPYVVGSPDLTNLFHHRVSVDVSADTTYEGRFEIEDGARLVAATVYEEHVAFLDDSDSIVTPQTFAAGADITDDQHTKLVVDNGHKLWRHNAGYLFNLVPETESGFWTRTTNSYANILDQSVTTHSSSSPGFNLRMQYWNPQHSDTVTCVFAVFGLGASSGVGDVKLVKSGADVVTISGFTNIAPGEWKQTNAALDGSNSEQKIDVHFQSNGASQLTVKAVSLYAYIT